MVKKKKNIRSLDYSNSFYFFCLCPGNLHLKSIWGGSGSQSRGESRRQTPRGEAFSVRLFVFSDSCLCFIGRCFIKQHCKSSHSKLIVCLRWMEWTSMKQNITQQLKLFVALVLQFPWQCYGSVWWSQRMPSPPRHCGQRMTTSRGRDGAVASPSTWRRLPAGLSSDSPPAWSETTRGWDSASQGVKAPRPTAQETRWDMQTRP